jgi:hypothetical protein
MVAIVSSDGHSNVGDLLCDLSQIGDVSVGYRARLLCKQQPRPVNARRLAYFKKVLAGDTWYE